MRDYAKTGDGILTALHLLQAVATSKSSLAELAKVMQRYPQVLVNVKDVDKTKFKDNPKIAAALSDFDSGLNGNGRILVRPSGTESLIRVMVEAKAEHIADEIAQAIAKIVRSELAI